MNIPKDILDKLCICDDLSCPKPHTIKELELETGEIIVLPDVDKTAEYKPTCPICKNDEETYGYEFKGQKEGYCNKCGNSFMEDGTLIIMDEDLADLPVKHIMIYDGNCYSCDSCEFETIWIKEASQHELVNDGGPPKPTTKSVKHRMSLDQTTAVWHCSTCTFETKLIQEVTAHENNREVKTETNEEKHYTKWKEKDIWACIYCPATFDEFNKALAHENDAGRKANPVGNYITSSNYKHCTHKPQEVLKGDDWSIWAGRKYDCETSLNKFDIVLNLTGNRISKRHEIPIKALKKWESKEKFTEICLDWPDRGVVSLPKEWWRDLLNHIKSNKLKMVVFCVGGHGRTGTAVSSLLVTAFGWSPKEATEWVWKNYCDEAVETNGQIQYVYNLVGQTYIPPNADIKPDTKQSGSQTAIINGWDND